MEKLTEMLRYMRPEGSVHQQLFCQRFLEPVFGDPDEHGNYVHIIMKESGAHPSVCFTAHHDTVHKQDGMQYVLVTDKRIITAPQSDCLGADCTTGVWLILGMIEANVPGVYVVHAGEEIGCWGSSALIRDNPEWLNKLDAVISFDRRGIDSVVTHQLGRRTCSDVFAKSLIDALGMGKFKPDPTGAYTDSNEYADVIPECTNISVGYYGQHTKAESQDLTFAYSLLESLIQANWDSLIIDRTPTTEFWSNYDYVGSSYKSNYDNLTELVEEYPEEVAAVLEDWGCDAEYLWSQIKVMRY